MSVLVLVFLTATALTVVFVAVTLAAGLLALRHVHLSDSMGLAGRFGLAFALGHLGIGILLQLLAVYGMFYKTVIAALLIAVVVGGWPSLAGFGRELKARIPARVQMMTACRRLWNEDRSHAVFLLAASASVLFGLLPLYTAVFGPTMMDALAYYLAQGKVIAYTNEMAPVLGYGGFQVLSYAAEMPFALMFLFAGDLIGHYAAKATIYPVVLATMALMWAIARCCGLKTLGRWIACMLLISSSSHLLVAFDGKSDLISNLYGLAALLSLLSTLRASLNSGAIVFGLLSGGAIIAKFSVLAVLPPAFAVVVAWKFWKQWKLALKYAAIAAAAVSFTLVAGWALKNTILFNDPIAPFYRFHESTPTFNTKQIWYSDENTQWIRATYPLALTFGRYPMQYGQLSVGWILLLPLFFVVRSFKDKSSLVLLAGGLVGIATWVYLRPSTFAPRYILIVLSMLMFAFAYAADTAFNSPRARGLAIPAIAALIMVTLLIDAASLERARTAKEYFKAYLAEPSWNTVYRWAQRMNRVPEGGRILFLSYQHEYLRRDLLSNLHSHRPFYSVYTDPEAFWEVIDEQGVRYIGLDKTHPIGKAVDMKSAPPDVELIEHEFLSDYYYFYEIKKKNDPG